MITVVGDLVLCALVVVGIVFFVVLGVEEIEVSRVVIVFGTAEDDAAVVMVVFLGVVVGEVVMAVETFSVVVAG